MTVIELIKHLQTYAKVSPENGMAQVFLRGSDEESCHEIVRALDGKGMPGQHFMIFVPKNVPTFKMLDAMKIS